MSSPLTHFWSSAAVMKRNGRWRFSPIASVSVAMARRHDVDRTNEHAKDYLRAFPGGDRVATSYTDSTSAMRS